MIFLILLASTSAVVFTQNTYNPNPTGIRNQTWMSLLDYGLPIRQMSIVGTHNSVVFDSCFLITATTQECQACSLQIQLQSGIRAIDIRVGHKNNKFQVYDRDCVQGSNFDQVLATVKAFLTAYSSQIVLLHLVEQTKASGSSRTFQDTFIAYRDAYPDLFWIPTNQDPQLGEVRGKIVLLQEFNSKAFHGLLWASFSVLPHKYFNTNWDLYTKWLDIKGFLPTVNTARKSKIMFWTGHGGSYPYFIASGKSSKQGSRLSTGLTTPSFKSYFPDFPRVACFIGICSIVFEGMNIMAYNFLVNNGFTYTGIVFTDFYGDDLLKKIIEINSAAYAKCTAVQVTQGCTLCQIGTGACLKCNANLHYVYDIINKVCLAEVNYYLDASFVSQLCRLAQTGCLQCTSATACTKCDTLAHYQLAFGQCIAEPGYYLDVTSIPVKCPQTGCAQCSDAVICTQCSTSLNYIFDSSTGQTCKCDQTNHFTESTSVQACICTANYFLSATSACELMPKCPDTSPIGGCLDCGSPTNAVCLNCDETNNFIFDPTHQFCICASAYFYDGNSCSSCTVKDAACDQCASQNLCLSCITNFTLIAGVCQCNFQYYLVDSNTCNLCSTGCFKCTRLGACSLCDTTNNFFLDSAGYCQCVAGMYESSGFCYPCGSMAGCLNCNTAGCTVCESIFGFHLDLGVCVCDYGFFINAMEVCEQCTMQGCLNCVSQSQCTQCNSSLYYLSSNGKCDDKCGDGIRIYVDCDDGNLVNGDGCSSSCKVEADYTCTGGSLATPDVCSYSGIFNLTVIKAIKDEKKNKVYLQIAISPYIQPLSGINFSQAITPKFPYDTKLASFDSNSSMINFQFTYSSSLNSLTSNDLSLSFDPPNNNPEYFFMKSAATVLPQVTDNNLALKSYDDTIYGLIDVMKTITGVTAFLYVGVTLICFLFLSKLIAIELLLVPQVAFTGLIMIEKIQALLQPLNNLKITNGYNSLITDIALLPPRLTILSYQGQFLSNFNICFGLLLVSILIGLVMLAAGKILKSKLLRRYSYKALNQWTFSLLIIFQFQFTVSYGVDIYYGSSIIGKILGGLLFAGLFIFIALFIKKPENFGEFKSQFKKESLVDLNHYVFVIAFRILLALNLIILSANKACGFVGLGITSFYGFFLVIKRPYLKNIRPIVNIGVITGVLSIETIYKMNFYSSETSFITNYLPLFVVILLLVLLLLNIIFMVLETVERVKKSKLDQYQNSNKGLDDEMKKEIERRMQVINTIQLSLNPKNLRFIQKRQSPGFSDFNQGGVQDSSKIKLLQKQLKKSLRHTTEGNQLVYLQI